MAVFAEHYLLQMIGTLGTPAKEVWSCGIRLYGEDYTGFDEEGWFEGVGRTAPQEWMLRTGSKISNQAALTGVKFNRINAAGHYADSGNTREYVYPTPVVGGGGASSAPFQCTVALTWLTDARSRGRASKGRIFSPAPAVSVTNTTGLFSAADALLMATSAALLLNTLDAGFGLGGTIRPHIMSGVDGTYSEINSVSVDNRVDTQRRRAASLVGLKSVAPVSY